MAPVQAKKRTRKQGAQNAGSLFPVCPFFPIFYCELNTVQQEDPLPQHDSDGSATGLPIRTLVTGPPNSRFGFKLNSPPHPGYVGSQEIETFQKRLEKSLPTATPTAANRHQCVARTVASTPTVSNKHSRRQVHPTIDEPHSPLSELSEVPEEQLEDKRYPSDNGNSDQDLYNHPMDDDDLFDGPVDGAFSAFDDPQADNDAMDAGSTDNQFNPDNHEDGSRLGSDNATPVNSEHEQSPVRREIDQASSHQSHIVQQSFKFQCSAIQPLHGSNIQNHSLSHTV
ncbi:hypothetical protein JVT61DRAFT_14898 [Boletus reticuloceps]|uniref:Uncharacterized protein n=1 Tax=Boletus reticuloceps TaxID=495285 RepID=A0A8I2YCN1_9AGAM|nr:hypothetical protein JVT61DRAFT_14898 [Boletus reticuloceps]